MGFPSYTESDKPHKPSIPRSQTHPRGERQIPFGMMTGKSLYVRNK